MDVQEIEQEYVSSWKNPVDKTPSTTSSLGAMLLLMAPQARPSEQAASMRPGAPMGLHLASLSHPSPGLMHTRPTAGFPLNNVCGTWQFIHSRPQKSDSSARILRPFDH